MSRFRPLAILAASAALAATTTAQNVLLENGIVRFTFSTNDYHLSRFEHLGTGSSYTCSATDPWSILLRDSQLPCPNGNKITLVPSGALHTSSHTLTIGGGVRTLTIRWDNVVIDPLSQVDLVATLRLLDGEEVLRATLDVDLQSSRYSLFEVEHPRFQLGGIGSSNEEFLLYPWREGLLLPDPRSQPLVNNGFFESKYHPGLVSLQFLTYFTGSGSRPLQNLGADTVYLGTEDSDGHIKRLVFDSPADDAQLRIVHSPADAIVPDTDFTTPYESLFGVMEGDWYDAAQFYREWALQQPFLARGPLETTTEIPTRVKEADFYGRFGDLYPVAVDYQQATLTELDAWKDFLNEPAPTRDPANNFHTTVNTIYGWHANEPLNVDWPEYRDANGSFVRNTQGMLDNAGPDDLWVNYYLALNIGQGTPTYQSAPSLFDNNSNKDECGNPITKTDLSGGVNARMNLSSTFYKNLTGYYINDTVENPGFNGVYLDAWDTKAKTLEYSGQNGHPMGGGNYYYEGMLEMLDVMRNEVAPHEPEFMISSEHLQEMFGSALDVQSFNPLTSAPGTYLFPLFTTVYNDYILKMTLRGMSPAIDYTQFGTLSTFAWAMYFAMGMQPSPANKDQDFRPTFPVLPTDPPEYLNFYSFLRNVYRAQQDNRAYHRFGQKLRSLTLAGVGETPHTGIPNNLYNFASASYPDLPNVISDVRRASDGSLAIFLVNWTDSAETVGFTFSFADYGLQVGQNHAVRRVGETTVVPLGFFSSDFTLSGIQVPAEDIVVIRVIP